MSDKVATHMSDKVTDLEKFYIKVFGQSFRG